MGKALLLMNPTVSRNSTIRMNPTVQNSHTVTDQFNSLDQTNPISWGGGVTGGQKDEWVWLVGSEPLGLSVLQEKPGHSTESRREGEAERKDRKWGLKVTQRGKAMFKKNPTNLYLSPLGKTGPLPREKLSRILLGKAAQDRYTKVIWPGLSNYWSMARPRFFHVMLPASITSSYFKTTHSGAARTSFFPFLKKKWASCCLSTNKKNTFLQDRIYSDLWPPGFLHNTSISPFFFFPL